MSRRSTPQCKIDEAAFPVRILVEVPETGFGRKLTEMSAWLSTHIGRGNYANHSGARRFVRASVADTATFYFRDARLAADFVETFNLQLADGTTCPTYSSPMMPLRAGR